MKFLVLLLFPILTFGQSKLDTVVLVAGKVKIIVPNELTSMSEQMWTLKYQRQTRPMMVLTDEDGEVNLTADMTKQKAVESQLASFKDVQIQRLKKSRPDLKLLDEGIKIINGKKVAFFKFIIQAIDQKVFNYYFFTLVDGNILLFTFNCIEKLQSKWESTADKIVNSFQAK